MIPLYKLSRNDFIQIPADQIVSHARDAALRLSPSEIIVRRWHQGEAYHYLYTTKEFLLALEDKPADAILEDEGVLNLHESEATPAVDAYRDAEISPLKCVIIDNDSIIGFYDARLPPARQIARSMGDGTSNSREGQDLISRSLLASFPERVSIGSISSLLIRLGRHPKKKEALQFAVPLGTELDIVVEALQGFLLEGPSEGKISVTSDEETLPIQFKLRATEIGPGRIRVLAFKCGQPLGAVMLAPSILAEGQISNQAAHSESRPLAPIPAGHPDLTLFIQERKSPGGLEIMFLLSALDPDLGLNLKSFGPIELKTDPLQYFEEFFKDIEGMSLNGPDERSIATRKLSLRGVALFQNLLPEDLRLQIWNLQDRIGTVQILSDEPWIPWELLKLQGRQGEKVVEGRFMSEAFAMTRWFPGIGRQPRLSLKNIALVVPGDSKLPNAQKERSYILSLADDQRRVVEVPATYLDVIETLSRGEHNVWHFTGHGRFDPKDPNHSAIRLERGQTLLPIDISGEVSNCRLGRPLVFLNACQTGREALSLTGIGGWAKSFIGAGAAGFIGSLWSVDDEVAYKFAMAFYDNLLSGKPIGEAAKGARESVRELNDPTWLAYTIFADPTAIVA